MKVSNSALKIIQRHYKEWRLLSMECWGWNGEVVSCAGSSSRMTAVTEGNQVMQPIVAIVDAIEIKGSYAYQKDQTG